MATQIAKTLLLMLAVLATASGPVAVGQQPQQPSQQYDPAAPAVHVPSPHQPAADIDRLQLNQARQQLVQQGQYPASATQRYYNNNRPVQDSNVRQTTFQQPAANVPDILAGDLTIEEAARRQAAAELEQRAAVLNTAPLRIPSQPVTAPVVNTPAQPAVEPQVDSSVIRAQGLVERPAGQFVSAPQTQMPAPQQPAVQNFAPPAAQPIVSSEEMIQARPMQADSLPTDVAPVNQVRQVSREETVTPSAIAPAPATIRPSAPAMTGIENTGTETAASSRMVLPASSITVRTIGPESIGINKPASFQVIVENVGNIDADKVIVGIDIPEWVELGNLNMTNGHKQITNGHEQARLIWTVDRIPAGQRQTLTIDTVARKSEMFDLAVEWTFAPRKGISNVMVTEPRLEMNISGPTEVQYGETAVYHVSVRNPGTGTAENVFVMLPESLGGERAPLENIPAGQERNFQVELLARTAGELVLTANATGDAELAASAKRDIIVRRGNLGVTIEGPKMKYAGSSGGYQITIENTGDAVATDVVAAIALPPGVTYLRGTESANQMEGGLKWPVGSLAAGDKRTYRIDCQLDSAGNLQLEAGARANGDLAASAACITVVETVADLVLTVADPKGPLPTGQNVEYQIKVVNRGSRSASDVKLVMQFSEGIEPNAAMGLQHRLVPGQVLFAPIAQIDPGEEMSFTVTAQAQSGGTHVFRAQLTCPDSDAREIAEGTTRFFGDEVSIPVPQESEETAENNDFAPQSSGEFKR